MSFWKKSENEHLNSAEYESVAKKLVEISTRLEELENKIKILTTNYDNLRGNFNRKLAGINSKSKGQDIDAEDEGTGQTQTINNPVILPYNGAFK